MTLDAIIFHYVQGSLADQPDSELLDAQTKVETWHAWRHENPDAKPTAVPNAEVLSNISVTIQNITNTRYGCND